MSNVPGIDYTMSKEDVFLLDKNEPVHLVIPQQDHDTAGVMVLPKPLFTLLAREASSVCLAIRSYYRLVY